MRSPALVFLNTIKQVEIDYSALRDHQGGMSHLLFIAYFKGLALAAGLIVAIGSQNMFVLRQGLKREHVLPIILLCMISDALLMWAGVSGLGTVLSMVPGLKFVLALGGAMFLAWYGLSALRRAVRPTALILQRDDRLSLAAALGTAAAFTFLNPHVYIDTVMLIGTVGSGLEPLQRPAFVLGTVTASVVWFSALGYGARFLAPLFARPVAWRVLDTAIACLMMALAFGLLMDAISEVAAFSLRN